MVINFLRDNRQSRSHEDTRQAKIDSNYLGEWIPEDDDAGQEDESLQIDGKSGYIHPEENGIETVTIVKNGGAMTYWVWGRPKEPERKKFIKDKLEPQPIEPNVSNVIVLYEADPPTI